MPYPDIDILLDRNQRDAVERQLSKRGIFTIVGPPGTGKTRVTAVEATLAVYDCGERVLMAALGNATANNMCWELVNILGKEEAKSLVIRTGNPAGTDPNLPIKFERSWDRVRSKPIVVTTLHSSRHLPRGMRWDRGIVDETGIERLEQILMLIEYLADPYAQIDRTKAFDAYNLTDVLEAYDVCLTNVGDPKQAKPISPSQGDLSVIEYFMRRRSYDQLRITRRLPNPLDVVVDQFADYSGLWAAPEMRDRRLKLVHEPNSLFKNILSSEPVITFVDVAGFQEEAGPTSWQNPIEAKVTARIAREALRCTEKPSTIITTRFTGQRNLIAEHLRTLGIPNFEPKTTTEALGLEEDVAIFSLTKNNPSHWLGAAGTLQDLNVAISRARSKLIIVGSYDMLANGWRRAPTIDAPGIRGRAWLLARLCQRHGEIVECPPELMR
jgi:hypothetical protein